MKITNSRLYDVVIVVAIIFFGAALLLGQQPPMPGPVCELQSELKFSKTDSSEVQSIPPGIEIHKWQGIGFHPIVCLEYNNPGTLEADGCKTGRRAMLEVIFCLIHGEVRIKILRTA